MPNLVYMGSFIKICYKLMKIWDPKLANFYKEMYVRGHLLPLAYISSYKLASLGSHTFTSLPQIFWFSGMINILIYGVAGFLFRWKIQKNYWWYCMASVKRSIYNPVSSTSLPFKDKYVSNITCPGQVLVWSFNDLVDRQIAWPLAHRASENEKVLAQKKTLLVLDIWMALILSPVSVVDWIPPEKRW